MRWCTAHWNTRVDGAQADDDLLAFLETNVVGSVRLMQAARTAGVSQFIFISTCAVHDVILGDRPLDETHPLWPKSHYGAHKAAIENFVHSFGLPGTTNGAQAGWDICSLRPTGNLRACGSPRRKVGGTSLSKTSWPEKRSTMRGAVKKYTPRMSPRRLVFCSTQQQRNPGVSRGNRTTATTCTSQSKTSHRLPKTYQEAPVKSLRKTPGPQNQIGHVQTAIAGHDIR